MESKKYNCKDFKRLHSNIEFIKTKIDGNLAWYYNVDFWLDFFVLYFPDAIIFYICTYFALQCRTTYSNLINQVKVDKLDKSNWVNSIFYIMMCFHYSTRFLDILFTSYLY